jgi:hypothetical protein
MNVTDPSGCYHHDVNHSSLSIASGKATETQDIDCVEWCAQVFGQIIICLSTSTAGS